MNEADIHTFFRRLSEGNPNPETELNFKNVYTLLVAVVLSAQSTDVGVNKATKRLFEMVTSPEEMIALGELELKEHIRTIGLFNSKARNIIALSQRLIDDFNGEVPTDRDSLESLPGVGRKTANVICNTAFGQRTIAVDTHLFRVANRVGLASGRTPLAVEKQLLEVVPQKYLKHAHHWLILFGRYICKARKPDCPNCPVNDLCDLRNSTTSNSLDSEVN